MDYAYTLQGWIKGVNSNTLDKSRDIGQDGLTASINSGAAKDAFGYTLNYHANDYSAIQGLRWNNATDRFETVTAGSDLTASGNDLFNGNITSMVTTIEQPMVYTSALNQAPNVLPQSTAYKYDQLNRLKEMKAYSNLNIPTNIWQSGSTYTGMYNNKFNYDANGNITNQERADGSGMMFDKMNYKYKLDVNGKTSQNRLYHVNDLALTTAAIDDIDDQGAFNSNPLTANDGVTNNYQYDEIGNLKKDKQEEILRIDWTVYGKIKSIIRTSTSTKSDLEFNYDASGNRISKIEKPHGSSIENGGANNTGLWTTTYYTRDAQGNIMTTYKFALPGGTASFKAIERNLFGSSRLGTDNTEVELVGVLPTANPFARTLGNKHYEGSNHLGNVLVVFTDKKIPVTTNGTTIDHFDADVENTFDYTPFGAPMNERSYRLVMKKGPTYATNPNDKSPAFVNGNEPLANIASENPKYRYGFNGKENDNEVKGNGNHQDYGMRIYDPRLGRFLSVDPLSRSYPWYTPYQFAGNKPIENLDLDGLEDLNYRFVKVEENGNAIVQIEVTAGTTSRSNRGIVSIHNLGSGKTTTDTKSSLLNIVLGISPNSPSAVNPNIQAGVGGNPPIGTGVVDYYVQLRQTDLAATGVKVMQKNSEGNHTEAPEQGGLKSTMFTLAVPPEDGPSGAWSATFDKDKGITSVQNSLLKNIENSVNYNFESSGQTSKDVKKMTVGYGSNSAGVFTEAYKTVIQKTFPNAVIDYKVEEQTDSSNKSIDAEFNGTPVQTLTE